MTIEVRDSGIDPLDLKAVVQYLQNRGTHVADVYRGNDCIWVVCGQRNEYFILRHHHIVSIEQD